MKTEEVWFTLESIAPSASTDKLFCISVDSPDRQFLAGTLGIPTHNTDEGKEIDAMKGEAQLIISSIARLGRAAGVHILVATQRPDASLLPGELKANLTTRVNCGRTNPTASSMILDSSEGTRVNGSVRGRLYVQNHGKGHHGQGFFQTQDWIDEWLKKRGVNPDGSPLGSAQKRTFSNNIDEFEGADLDTKSGISNEEYIRQLEEEDARLESTPVAYENISEPPADPPTDAPLVESSFGRPELGAKSSDKLDPYHRPEDDFDSDLEDLLAMNNEGD